MDTPFLSKKRLSFIALGVLVIVAGISSTTKFLAKKQNAQEIAYYLEKNEPTIPEGYEEIMTENLYPRDPTLSVVTQAASVIVFGKVVDIEPPYYDEHRTLYHNVVIDPERFLKNTQKISEEEKIRVQIFGGEINKTIAWSPTSPAFSKQEEVLVFLSPTDTAGVYYVNYDAFGKLGVHGSRVEGISTDVGLIQTSLANIEKQIQKEISPQ